MSVNSFHDSKEGKDCEPQYGKLRKTIQHQDLSPSEDTGNKRRKATDTDGGNACEQSEQHPKILRKCENSYTSVNRELNNDSAQGTSNTASCSESSDAGSYLRVVPEAEQQQLFLCGLLEENDDHKISNCIVNNAHLLFAGRFAVSRFLGGGSDGNVYHAIDNGGFSPRVAVKQVALKVVHEKKKLLSEYNTLKFLQKYNQFSKCHIVRAFDIGVDFQWMSLELLDTDLHKYLYLQRNSLDWEQVTQITRQLLKAVEFLHILGYTHTDVKPANILLTHPVRKGKEPHVKLIDFSQAVFNNTAVYDHERITTLEYRAPEVFLDVGWDRACDVWSIGCTAFEIFKKEDLFTYRTEKENCDTYTLECLSVIQKVTGTRLHEKLFDRDSTRSSNFFSNITGELLVDQRKLWNPLIANNKPYREYFEDADIPERGLLRLIQSLIVVNPDKRKSPTDALQDKWFKKFQKYSK